MYHKVNMKHESIEHETCMDKIMVNHGAYTNGSSTVNNHGFTKNHHIASKHGFKKNMYQYMNTMDSINITKGINGYHKAAMSSNGASTIVYNYSPGNLILKIQFLSPLVTGPPPI